MGCRCDRFAGGDVPSYNAKERRLGVRALVAAIDAATQGEKERRRWVWRSK